MVPNYNLPLSLYYGISQNKSQLCEHIPIKLQHSKKSAAWKYHRFKLEKKEAIRHIIV